MWMPPLFGGKKGKITYQNNATEAADWSRSQRQIMRTSDWSILPSGSLFPINRRIHKHSTATKDKKNKIIKYLCTNV
jgi:hypothetical protein